MTRAAITTTRVEMTAVKATTAEMTAEMTTATATGATTRTRTSPVRPTRGNGCGRVIVACRRVPATTLPRGPLQVAWC